MSTMSSSGAGAAGAPVVGTVHAARYAGPGLWMYFGTLTLATALGDPTGS
jgi:hypothetical protein